MKKRIRATSRIMCLFTVITLVLTFVTGCSDSYLDEAINKSFFSVYDPPTKTHYLQFEKLDLTGTKLTCYKTSDNPNVVIPFEEFEKNSITVTPKHDSVLETTGDIIITFKNEESGLTATTIVHVAKDTDSSEASVTTPPSQTKTTVSSIVATTTTKKSSSNVVTTTTPKKISSSVVTTTTPKKSSSNVVTTTTPKKSSSNVVTTTTPKKSSSNVVSTTTPKKSSSNVVTSTTLPTLKTLNVSISDSFQVSFSSTTINASYYTKGLPSSNHGITYTTNPNILTEDNGWYKVQNNFYPIDKGSSFPGDYITIVEVKDGKITAVGSKFWS